MRDLKLETIEEPKGAEKALVFVGGYFSDSEQERELDVRWWEALVAAGWEGAIYRLIWDASTPVSDHVLAPMPIRLMLPGEATAYIPGSVAAGMGSAVLHHRKIRARTREIGEDHLLDFLREQIGDRRLTLLGHSSGGQIVFHALRAAAALKKPVENALFVGTTVGGDEDWEAALEGVSGVLLNIYHPYDRILTFFHRTFRSSPHRPVGLDPLEIEHERLMEFDASELRKGDWRRSNHWLYRYVLEEACAPVFSEGCGVRAAS